MSKRSLPILVERTVADIHALRLRAASEFERKLRDTWGAATTCTKGCSGCCHHPFFISVAEGILLYKYLARHGLWTPSLQQRVKDTRDKTLGVSWGVWMLSNTPCSLLEDNLCIAYDARPLSCRVTYAVSDPELCHPHKMSEETMLVNRGEDQAAFNESEIKLLKRHGLDGVVVPLSEAVLAGEQVVTGKLSLERVERMFLADFARVAHGKI